MKQFIAHRAKFIVHHGLRIIALLAMINVFYVTHAQEAFYIYQNDGHMDAFFYDQIQKISYSRFDTDGTEHAEYVSQEIVTEERTYRIMLNAIDSVTFSLPTIATNQFTVPASGGNVEAGDITLSFPDGTFVTDTKVTVAEVAEGQVRADEASKFYQVTMPVSTGSEVIVSVKCDAPADDIVFVAHAPTVGMHDFANGHSDVWLEATYANGAYTATLPQFANGDDTEAVSLSLGLVHATSNGQSAVARKNMKAAGGPAQTVRFHVDWTRKNYYSADLDAKINQYAAAAIPILQGLGLEVHGTGIRDIPIVVCKNKDDGEWGGFRQSALCDEFSVVELNDKKLAAASDDVIFKTICHELMHYFQADYDPRSTKDKYKYVYCDLLMLREASGVWAEKLVGSSAVSEVLKDNVPYFFSSFRPLDTVYRDAEARGRKYQPHGYAMSSLLMYLTGKYGDKSIVDLSKKMRTFNTTEECIKDYCKDKKSDLFYTWQDYYDEFTHTLATGGIHSDLRFPDMELSGAMIYRLQYRKGGYTESYDEKVCPYGALATRVTSVPSLRTHLSEMENYRLTAKQEEAGITCYAYLWNREGKTATLLKQFTSDDKEVVLLEGIDDITDFAQYVNDIYITQVNTVFDDHPANAKLTLKLASPDSLKLTPEALPFDAQQATKTVSVESEIEDIGVTPSASWISARYVKSNKQIEVTVEANTSAAKREGTILVKAGNTEKIISVTQAGAVGEFDFSQVKAVKVTVRAKVKQVSNDPEDGESPRERMYSYEAWEYALNWESAWNCSVSVGEQGAAQITAKAQNNNDTYSIQISIDDVANGKITSCEVRHTWDEHFDDGAHYYIYHSASATNIPLPNSSGSTRGTSATGTTVTNLSQTYHYAWKDLTRTFIGSDDDEVTIQFLTSNQLYE